MYFLILLVYEIDLFFNSMKNELQDILYTMNIFLSVYWYI